MYPSDLVSSPWSIASRACIQTNWVEAFRCCNFLSCPNRTTNIPTAAIASMVILKTLHESLNLYHHTPISYKISGVWATSTLVLSISVIPLRICSFQKSSTLAIIESDAWTPSCIKRALKWGPHHSYINVIKFLREEYVDVIKKQQWIVLTAHLVQEMFALRFSPLGLVPQRVRHDRMISGHSYFDVNQQSLNITPTEVM